jgi:hypothetical protein
MLKKKMNNTDKNKAKKLIPFLESGIDPIKKKKNKDILILLVTFDNAPPCSRAAPKALRLFFRLWHLRGPHRVTYTGMPRSPARAL